MGSDRTFCGRLIQTAGAATASQGDGRWWWTRAVVVAEQHRCRDSTSKTRSRSAGDLYSYRFFTYSVKRSRGRRPLFLVSKRHQDVVPRPAGLARSATVKAAVNKRVYR